jgi:DNA invertase Pin-like site-specific DNA recombinase
MTSHFVDFNISPTEFVLYSRVSSSRQSNEAHGLDYQDMICENYMKEIFNVQTSNINYYCDVGSSYKSISKLKDLNLMIKDLVPNTVILVSEISRLGRNIHQVFPIFKKISDKKCWVISVSEGLCFNKTKLMDKQIYQKVIDAERESDLISMRTTNANNLIRMNGGHVGNVPYGKQRVKVNGVPVLIDDKKEMDIIGLINNIYKKHKNFKQVVQELNEKRVLKRNCAWTFSSVKSIIKKANPSVNDLNSKFNKFSF